VPWARTGSGFTLLFEAFAVTLCREMPVKAVEGIFGVCDDRLWRVLTHHVDKARAAEDHSGVARIGIDETASRRGQNYITVVHDLDVGRIIFACWPEGRDKSTVARLVEDLLAHGGSEANVTDVYTDLSKAYIASVAQYLPGATLSFDPFHVVALANKALEEVRRAEVKERPELKGSRWSWLKDAASWTAKQLATFHDLSRANLKTGRAYQIKEALRDLFALAENADQAEALFARWYS